ncbi:acyltransferase, partial [Vibrio sp. 10N.222.52.B7]|uniref:acyltransferase n=1 Tax=Vibrio sp. 10N.222.52.B7 TaxID=3229629 RepID=UPI00354F5CA1
NVYIGPNVSIVENVILGTEVIIGAGAVVTKNIPSYSTAVGVPARLIKTDIMVNKYVNRRWNCKCNS